MKAQEMKYALLMAIAACLVSYRVTAADFIECRSSINDKFLLINGLEVSEMNWPAEHVGSLTFRLAGDHGVELVGSSDDFELDYELFSQQVFRFDGEQYFGGGRFELGGQQIEMRTVLSNTQLLFLIVFETEIGGRPNKVVTGGNACFRINQPW